MPESGKNDRAHGAAPGGSDDEGSDDMVAVATSDEARPHEADRRDGYAEAITAFGRARAAAAQIEEAHAAFVGALKDVADGMAAVGTLDSWEEVLTTPFGDRSMPRPADLSAGDMAAWLGPNGYDLAGDVPDQLAKLQGLLRAAIDSAEPTDAYRAKLDALWTEAESAPSEPSVQLVPAPETTSSQVDAEKLSAAMMPLGVLLEVVGELRHLEDKTLDLGTRWMLDGATRDMLIDIEELAHEVLGLRQTANGGLSPEEAQLGRAVGLYE